MAEDYFVELLGTREGWPDDMSDEETRIMQEHARYVRTLVAKKKVLLAGPVLEHVFGLMVLRVADRAEAEAIMSQEPSVVQGVHTCRMRPMEASLRAHFVPSSRYPVPVSELALRKEVDVAASREDVWGAWTTPEGIASFLTPNCKVELRPGGPFEIYFDMAAPEGSRGSEDCALLSYEPPSMLSFEWNAPPQFGAIRDQRTIVILHFDDIGNGHTRVRFLQRGWGVSKQWDELYAYFDRAWDYVLSNLKESFEK